MRGTGITDFTQVTVVAGDPGWSGITFGANTLWVHTGGTIDSGDFIFS